eukprot:s2333_g6.t1
MLLPCAGESAKSVYNTPYSPRYIHGPSGGRRPSRLSQGPSLAQLLIFSAAQTERRESRLNRKLYKSFVSSRRSATKQKEQAPGPTERRQLRLPRPPQLLPATAAHCSSSLPDGCVGSVLVACALRTQGKSGPVQTLNS